jgi:pyruvate-formate lyase
MISDRLQQLKTSVRNRDQRRFRQSSAPDVARECKRENLSWPRRVGRLTRRMCEAERVVISPDERIVFTRTVPAVPLVYGEMEWKAQFAGREMHELGVISNICADWHLLLSQGLLGRKAVALVTRERMQGEPEAVDFLDAALESIDAVLELSSRYAAEARAMGRRDVAELMERVPAHPARTFHEALQSHRICHAVLWLTGHYHVGLGRFDQYLWPYLQADLETGRLSRREAEELLAEFFISLNKDSDLYPGIQQGDNGQSLMLGGVRRDGTDGVNELTSMILRVARDVSMIDPKINLRITKDTDLGLLELAAELTRKGLGFPQYSNDDLVIPALVAHGYRLEDARDYSVAACWEFVIPGKGMEIVNIGAVSFPSAVNRGVVEGLTSGDDFSGIKSRIAEDIDGQVRTLVERRSRILLPPAPYYSVLMDGCLEQGHDLSQGASYNNFGIHGAASANAADALAGVRKLVFEEKSVDPASLVEALASDFRSSDALRKKLSEEGPKVGTDDPTADGMLAFLFDAFATACERVTDNGRGGIVRPGTGSAMYYIWLATGHDGMIEPVVGATADGRKKGAYFSSSLAPSPGVRVHGPFSVLRSFSKIDYHRIMNGGPVTLELSDTVFRDRDSIRKVAMFIRSFAQIGCQQLQLNTLNVDTLKEAKEHPENHRDLIVRVWGWSGYFCELAPEYQDHIIARTMHAL